MAVEKIIYPIVLSPFSIWLVEGEPIGDGEFAVRKDDGGLWKIDHVETGFCACKGSTKRNCLKNFKALQEEKGKRGFAKAIRKARKFLREHTR